MFLFRGLSSSETCTRCGLLYRIYSLVNTISSLISFISFSRTRPSTSVCYCHFVEIFRWSNICCNCYVTPDYDVITWEHSSVVEHPTADRIVPGSNPGAPYYTCSVNYSIIYDGRNLRWQLASIEFSFVSVSDCRSPCHSLYHTEATLGPRRNILFTIWYYPGSILPSKGSSSLVLHRFFSGIPVSDKNK